MSVVDMNFTDKVIIGLSLTVLSTFVFRNYFQRILLILEALVNDLDPI